jgi:hypothetical protein
VTTFLTIWVAGFNACAELEKSAQIIGVAPGLTDQPADDVVDEHHGVHLPVTMSDGPAPELT